MKYYPNILLIAGAGRNVGKTMLACEIISHLSMSADVTAIKISSHFHPVEDGQKVIANTKNYHIIEENLHTEKDSSRMLRAGAKKAFYIQAKENNLQDAWDILSAEITDCPVVCESGALHKLIKPGLFFFVCGNKVPENKQQIFAYHPVTVSFNHRVQTLEASQVHFQDNQFYYVPKSNQNGPF
ncbi:hypothetical protein [Gaoshiqia sp. Z1-71]|uniref:hypothetical protein n=1 Tax=Gaoshiqia hydrogeniformans TaxID=3290090 RepID=UPI003BF78365